MRSLWTGVMSIIIFFSILVTIVINKDSFSLYWNDMEIKSEKYSLTYDEIVELTVDKSQYKIASLSDIFNISNKILPNTSDLSKLQSNGTLDIKQNQSIGNSVGNPTKSIDNEIVRQIKNAGWMDLLVNINEKSYSKVYHPVSYEIPDGYDKDKDLVRYGEMWRKDVRDILNNSEFKSLSNFSQDFKLSENWILAVINTESSFYEKAINGESSASGLMQLVKRYHEGRFRDGYNYLSTNNSVKVNELSTNSSYRELTWNPYLNITCGISYLYEQTQKAFNKYREFDKEQQFYYLMGAYAYNQGNDDVPAENKLNWFNLNNDGVKYVKLIIGNYIPYASGN